MESSNMNSRSSIQWLCGILVLTLIHGISCDSNSGCLRNGNTELHIEQCIGENGLEFVPQNIDGFLGKFKFYKPPLKCRGDNKHVRIQFGQDCTVDFMVSLTDEVDMKPTNKKGTNLNAHKLLLYEDGFHNEENEKPEIGTPCNPKLEAESKSLKLVFTDGEGTASIKTCGLYMKFDDALVRYTTSSSTTTTTAITTTTPPTPYLSTSHPTAPTDSSPESFIGSNWHWLLIVPIVIVLLLVVALIGLIVWCKRRNASRKVPVEEGKTAKDINMVTTRTTKEVEHKPWDRKNSDSSNDHPEPLSDPRNRDVGKGYENLQEFIENRPPAYENGIATEVQKKNPVDEEQYQNLQEFIENRPPAYENGIATEVQKKNPVDEEQYQNLQQGGPPAFRGGIATEVQKS